MIVIRKLILCASLAISPLALADLTIGQSVPTTGIAADTGKALAIGAAMYFSRVNAQGGINGEMINHVVLDDAYDAKRAISNTRTLVEKENALALVSYFGTGTGTELTQTRTLENANIALVGIYSGAQSVRSNPNIFHTRASYAEEVEKTIQLLTTHLGVTRIGIVAQNDGFGQDGVDAVKAALAKRKLQAVGEVRYDKNSGNVAQAAKDMAKLNPEAVLLVAISQPAARFLKQYRELGASSQIYSLSPVQYEEVDKAITRKLAHGLGISQVFPYPNDARLRLIREFQADSAAMVNKGEYPTYALLEGYISARLAVDALRRAGKAPSRESVMKSMQSLGRADLGGFVLDYSNGKRNGSSFVELTMVAPSGGLTR
ncbi:ABC transporter substrate-binding protein [Chitinilyticum piscinae]|uniref:ABC transporter substrate-binding protein n=1 Tax=Chitinilyticum piscinae TaxID=2866724 RepID=A0A8J7K2Q4_9NEIS|nr:ABC transporter substrate-binding protein [Chitinilyticum piscinae]MBE9610357.1 ABC transporter substrate-binding protein [Chitinilyticum piscinae]